MTHSISSNYCYINDAMGIDDNAFIAEDYSSCGATKKCYEKGCGSATIKGKCYRDADGCSNRLYRDLKRIWSKEMLQLKMVDSTRFNLIDCNGIRFSCDYIGPSRAWAYYVGIEDNVIGEYLLHSRTIGGHILWPVHSIPTINTARAGGGSFYDRIDYTLYEIRKFYLQSENTNKLPSQLWNVLHNEIEEKYLMCISKKQYGEDAFKSYIDFWLLQDFVMDSKSGDYRVISLARSDKNEKRPLDENEPIFPGNTNNVHWKIIVNGTLEEDYKKLLRDAYRKYSNNLIQLIKNRSERIVEALKVDN